MKKIIRGITILGLMVGIASSHANAQPPHQMDTQSSPTGQFRRIEQPLANRAIVTLGGLSLIGLEFWWFLLSKPKSRKASTPNKLH